MTVSTGDHQPRTDSSHRSAFFRNWLRDPFNVASIVPSGRSLAKLMASELAAGARVVELGPGTGTLTEAILERGVAPADLVLIERCPAFVGILARRFPGCTVLEADAADLGQCLAGLEGRIDCVVSGLPLVWFDKDKKVRILEGAFKLLGPSGRLHQFTYLGRPPVGSRLLRSLGLTASLMGLSPANLPPAFVYRFERAR